MPGRSLTTKKGDKRKPFQGPTTICQPIPGITHNSVNFFQDDTVRIFFFETWNIAKNMAVTSTNATFTAFQMSVERTRNASERSRPLCACKRNVVNELAQNGSISRSLLSASRANFRNGKMIEKCPICLLSAEKRRENGQVPSTQWFKCPT